MNKLLFVGALLGLLSVMMGAYIDHVLAARLSEQGLHSVSSAHRIQQCYALVICVIALASCVMHSRLLIAAGWTFVIGTLCFCLGIDTAILLGWYSMMKLAPIGGFLLMAGWTLLLGSSFSLIPSRRR